MSHSSMYDKELGQWIDVLTFDEICAAIRCRAQLTKDITDKYKTSYEKLKEEKWKDEELQKMKEEIEFYQRELNRGFSISKKEQAAIDEWREEHEERRHPNYHGNYVYEFTRTSLGSFGVFKCTSCAEEVNKELLSKSYATSIDKYYAKRKLVNKYNSEFEFKTAE